jgi:hypothetical protein
MKLDKLVKVDKQHAERMYLITLERLEKEKQRVLKKRLKMVLFGILFSYSTAWAEIDLNIIAKIESSNNPLAYNKSSQARGMYQITPICLKDYNRQNGTTLPVNALFKPVVARTVAEWVVVKRIPQLLRNYHLQVTETNILMAYNWGVGNLVKKGAQNAPLETKNYVLKYNRLKGGKN